MVKKNVNKYLKLHLNIYALLFVALSGLLLIICEEYYKEKDILLSIGTGIFSSAFCMFVYEIISYKQKIDEIINALGDICFDIEKYYHYTENCSNTVKACGNTKENLPLIKSVLTIDSFNVQLSGSMLLDEIGKYKKNYSLYLSNKIITTLEVVQLEIENNMNFISALKKQKN